MPVGVESASTSLDQGVRLAPFNTAPDDEVPTAAHGPGLPRGVPAVSRGSGGLLALVLRLPPGPGGMASSGRQSTRGVYGGGTLAVSRQQNVLSQS